jgi:hypothetical protein
MILFLIKFLPLNSKKKEMLRFYYKRKKYIKRVNKHVKEIKNNNSFYKV